MRKVSLSSQTENPNFIGSWIIEPDSICDDIIHYFESNEKRQAPGLTGQAVDTNRKNSIDISVSPNEILLPENRIFNVYFQSLFSCYTDYLAQWPFLEIFPEELHIGRFKIQRYQSGQHFQKVHTERANLATLHRLFAWMTYLNDVDNEDGGSTVFTHYDLKVQPKKGLTLIWPAEWTHAHKGELLVKSSKYIITGWMHFPS